MYFFLFLIVIASLVGMVYLFVDDHNDIREERVIMTTQEFVP